MRRLFWLVLAITISFGPLVASADIPISGLPTATSVAPADLVPCVHSGTTSKCTASQLWTPYGPIIFTGAGTYGTASQTYCAQDSFSTPGITCNIPTGSTNGFSWQINQVTQLMQLSASGNLSISGSFKTSSTTYGNNTINGSTFFPYTITKFASSGTFTTPSDSTTNTVYRYRMVGGGGGGGGANGSWAAGGGGASGSYAEGTFTGVSASTGITITIGAGGAGGSTAGGNGGNGGTTTIGSPVSVSCPGGNGGTGSTATSASYAAGGTNGGNCTGSYTLQVPGTNGGTGISVSGSIQIAGAGAGNPMSAGVPTQTSNTGTSPNGYGVGGSGGLFTGFAGGGNSQGLVIIERMTP